MARIAPASGPGVRSSPAPDRQAASPWVRSFDVLSLLSQLFDGGLEGQAGAGQLHVRRLGAEGIGFAVKFLTQEVELAADGAALGQHVAGGVDMGAQAV